MPLMTSTLALLLLMQAGQTATPPATPAPQATRPRPATLEVRVTDRKGAVLEGTHVEAQGPIVREGETNADGAVTFRNILNGTYRFRFEREGYITLEKEVIYKSGTPAVVRAELSPAPAPPPAPPPPPPAPTPAPAPAPPQLKAGEPRVVSIPDLAEKQLIGRSETTKETPIGCSGATTTNLLQARAPLSAHTHADADEVLYVVAGDATLMLGGKEHRVNSGTLIIVPRGVEHSIARRGGNPVILISAISGQPCS